jgi:hypothetical protein
MMRTDILTLSLASGLFAGTLACLLGVTSVWTVLMLCTVCYVATRVLYYLAVHR